LPPPPPPLSPAPPPPPPPHRGHLGRARDLQAGGPDAPRGRRGAAGSAQDSRIADCLSRPGSSRGPDRLRHRRRVQEDPGGMAHQGQRGARGRHHDSEDHDRGRGHFHQAREMPRDEEHEDPLRHERVGHAPTHPRRPPLRGLGHHPYGGHASGLARGGAVDVARRARSV
ncbi:unnamed protein product, partial [Prorocentrum cordatum]